MNAVIAIVLVLAVIFLLVLPAVRRNKVVHDKYRDDQVCDHVKCDPAVDNEEPKDETIGDQED